MKPDISFTKHPDLSRTDPVTDAADPVVRAFLQSAKEDGAWILPTSEDGYRIDGTISLKAAIDAAIQAHLKGLGH